MMDPGGVSKEASAGLEGGGSAGGGGSTWSLIIADAVISPMRLFAEDGLGGWQSAKETEGGEGGSAGTDSPEKMGCREEELRCTDAPGLCCI